MQFPSVLVGPDNFRCHSPAPRFSESAFVGVARTPKRRAQVARQIVGWTIRLAQAGIRVQFASNAAK